MAELLCVHKVHHGILVVPTLSNQRNVDPRLERVIVDSVCRSAVHSLIRNCFIGGRSLEKIKKVTSIN